jgi:hypothetical protein
VSVPLFSLHRPSFGGYTYQRETERGIVTLQEVSPMPSFGSLLGKIVAGLRGGRPAAAGMHDAVPGKPKLEVYQNGKWIPLREAAQILYDELDGTQWRMAAETEDTPEARLDYMALHLVHNAPIDGRSPPSSAYKTIPEREFDSGVFKGGGKYFQRYYDSYLTYLDMRVRAEDLRDAVKKLRAGK